MFVPLPTKMDKLEEALQRLDTVAVLPPPPFVEIGRKLRAVYERERAQKYQLLANSEWRQLPYALWVDGMPTLVETDPELLQRYWEEVLPDALRSSPRRAKRWLMPLFYVYCVAFDPGALDFLSFASKLRQALPQADGAVVTKLRDIDESQDFFTPNRVPASLASLFFTFYSVTIDEQMAAHLLWPGFTDTCLGTALLRAALQLPPEHLREHNTVLRLLEWLKQMPASIAKTQLRTVFADALLLPWWPLRKMEDKHKKLLLHFFLREYGDPRFARHVHYQWEGVSQHAIAVMQYLLTGDTLKGFMRILERTADEIWRYRQKFWMAYYDAGYIDAAWMVLGSHAQLAAQSSSDTGQQNFGRLEGGATPNQSVLLLRIGDLIFSEWSHNGSLRAYHDGDPEAPHLHGISYRGNELRDAASLDFHDGLNMRPELRHMHSESGTWQRKARDLIRRQSGIQLNDREILL